MRWIYLVAGLLLGFGAHANPGTPLLSVRCSFQDGQATEFSNTKPITKRSNDMGDLIFDQIDVRNQTARVIGSIGAETIIALYGNNSIHLLETTISGNLNITTVYLSTKSLRDGIYPTVHSRHINLASGPYPSHYVGFCKKLY